MSLNSLATSYVAHDLSRTPRGKDLKVDSEETPDAKTQDVQNALSALVEYVPAETITLYLAALASLPALADLIPGLRAAQVYWLFAALTPLLFGLIYGGKRRAAGETRWPGWKLWPWWPMIAATIAFLVWGLAIPGAPFLTSESGRAISGLVALIASTLLGVAGRFFAPKPESAA